MTRWTMWGTPFQFMGMELGPIDSAVMNIVLGAGEVAVGVTMLRLKKQILPLGMFVYGIETISCFLGRSLLPGWIANEVVARRAYQGVAVRPGKLNL